MPLIDLQHDQARPFLSCQLYSRRGPNRATELYAIASASRGVFLNGSSLPSSNKLTVLPSCVSKLHSFVSNYTPVRKVSPSPDHKIPPPPPKSRERKKKEQPTFPILPLLTLLNLIIPLPLFPFTANRISTRPCSWFISPQIHGIWSRK